MKIEMSSQWGENVVVNHCEMEMRSHERHRFGFCCCFWQTNTTLFEISEKIKDHTQNINPPR